ncbi:SDR family NAD(P)-dependent oxidoreductase [Paracoccus liaowanqingii]|nr:SDR family NAD(P)-dependent oxidoreductase [Paracoccus liaowanqingii]
MSGLPQSLIAVVTGASSGLGRALSQSLTEKGLHVIGIARNIGRLEETARNCRAGFFTAIAADVSCDQEMVRVASDIENNMGPVSILVNNAAICLQQDFLNSTSDEINDHIRINCCGPIIASKVFIPGMLQRRRGRIINVGSFAGEGPAVGKLGYSVSKAGFRSFSMALATELECHLPSIVVTEWIPGIMATQIGDDRGLSPSLVASWGAELALDFRPELHGLIFLQDRELQNNPSLRRRIADKVLFRSRRGPYVLSPTLANSECKNTGPKKKLLFLSARS